MGNSAACRGDYGMGPEFLDSTFMGDNSFYDAQTEKAWMNGLRNMRRGRLGFSPFELHPSKTMQAEKGGLAGVLHICKQQFAFSGC